MPYYFEPFFPCKIFNGFLHIIHNITYVMKSAGPMFFQKPSQTIISQGFYKFDIYIVNRYKTYFRIKCLNRKASHLLHIKGVLIYLLCIIYVIYDNTYMMNF